jgi:hypothetical protein
MMNDQRNSETNSQILIYQADDGSTKVDVLLEQETVCSRLNRWACCFKSRVQPLTSIF